MVFVRNWFLFGGTFKILIEGNSHPWNWIQYLGKWLIICTLHKQTINSIDSPAPYIIIYSLSFAVHTNKVMPCKWIILDCKSYGKWKRVTVQWNNRFRTLKQVFFFFQWIWLVIAYFISQTCLNTCNHWIPYIHVT